MMQVDVLLLDAASKNIEVIVDALKNPPAFVSKSGFFLVLDTRVDNALEILRGECFVLLALRLLDPIYIQASCVNQA
jgi:hypothetical protein